MFLVTYHRPNFQTGGKKMANQNFIDNCVPNVPQAKFVSQLPCLNHKVCTVGTTTVGIGPVSARGVACPFPQIS